MAPRRSRRGLWFFLFILSLGLTGYFIGPKIIKSTSKAETEPAVKEQIIKPIPMPNMENLSAVQEHAQSPEGTSQEIIYP